METDRTVDNDGKEIEEKQWSAVNHGGVDKQLYEKYRYELFGLVSAKVEGEANKNSHQYGGGWK